jgi:hypothetical protein
MIDDPVMAVIAIENAIDTMARAAVGLREYSPTMSGADNATAINV